MDNDMNLDDKISYLIRIVDKSVSKNKKEYLDFISECIGKRLQRKDNKLREGEVMTLNAIYKDCKVDPVEDDYIGVQFISNGDIRTLYTIHRYNDLEYMVSWDSIDESENRGEVEYSKETVYQKFAAGQWIKI